MNPDQLMAPDQLNLTGFLLNNYLLEKRISEAGELEVYAGRHQHLNRPVTVQVIRAGTIQHEVWEQHVAAEASFLARVVHANVVHIYDVGIEDDGTIYVVTEQIDGRPLDQILEERTYLEHGYALRVTREIARGIAAFHRLGLLTSELDPASVVVVNGPLVNRDIPGEPWVKLLDLGLGCAVGCPRKGGLPDGAARRYLAPEAVRAEPLTEHADIYSLGILLRDLLLGGIKGANLVRGSAVERLVSDCTAIGPGDRPTSVFEFLDRLDTAEANWSFGAAIQSNLR